MSPRRNREFWDRIVRELEQSKLSHEEFADQRNVNVRTLRKWLYRLRSERGRVVRVLPVRVRRDTAVTPPAIVEVGIAGMVVRATVETDVAYVVELVTRLRDRC